MKRLTWIPLVALVSAVPASAQDATERFVKRHDANGDGKLTRGEFPPRLRRMFDRIDADRNGFVTVAEDRAFRARRAERRPGRNGRSRRTEPDHANVRYGPHERNVIDLWLPPKTAKKPPLLVWIHGGGWTMGSKSRINPMFGRLTGEGYAAASLDYRLTGLASHPDQTHDVKGAIRWLRAHAGEYGYDARRIGVGGGSAGGHLALMLGLTGGVDKLEGDVGGNRERSSRVQAVVDLFGPGEFEAFARENARFGRRHPLGLEKDASPLTSLTKDDAPVLIFHGDRDRTVPLSQSKLVHERYGKAGLESALHVIEGAGHGGPRFSDDIRYALVKAFLDRHVKGAR